MAKDLSPAKCILLTIHYASEGNVKALHSFTPTRSDALDPELILRILLTYLPESLEPREYTSYIREVASRLYLDHERQDVEIDISPVKDINEEQAKKRVRKLKLLDIIPPSFPPHAPEDLLVRFLCHRAYRIDSETGMLNLVPQLVEPFLERSDYLRTWYISVVLPLLRIEFEYYEDDERIALGLSDFEKLEGREGIDFLLEKSVEDDESSTSTLAAQKQDMARDIRGLVGPWMYGHTERKRRKLDHPKPEKTCSDNEGLANGVSKISLAGVSEEDKTGHDWEYLYRWMVFHAKEKFPLITNAVEDWDGPVDVDLGGFSTGNSNYYLDEDVQKKLEAQYAQAAFASCYAAQADDEETIRCAHGILARLASLLDFIPPPDLATSVDSLPKIERHAANLDTSRSTTDLEPSGLLRPEHPLTTPRFETYMLLQMMVYSAYQFSGLGYPISLGSVAKLHFTSSVNEQLAVLKKILRHVSNGGSRKDESRWTGDRAKLMWLWNWGIDEDDEQATTGPGVLGRIPRQTFEEEMLKCFIESSCRSLFFLFSLSHVLLLISVS
jgi:protein transport protein SEC39